MNSSPSLRPHSGPGFVQCMSPSLVGERSVIDVGKIETVSIPFGTDAFGATKELLSHKFASRSNSEA